MEERLQQANDKMEELQDQCEEQQIKINHLMEENATLQSALNQQNNNSDQIQNTHASKKVQLLRFSALIPKHIFNITTVFLRL